MFNLGVEWQLNLGISWVLKKKLINLVERSGIIKKISFEFVIVN